MDGMRIKKEALCCERIAGTAEEQIAIEGEASLPGSMRDAVTVLSVQADAYLTEIRPEEERAAVQGKAVFTVLYTQGDLTRIRTLETGCAFEHRMEMKGIGPGMRMRGRVCVLEAQGSASGGRMHLGAELRLDMQAYEAVTRQIVAEVESAQKTVTQEKEAELCCIKELCREQVLAREEFDVEEETNAAEVLGTNAWVNSVRISGGATRVTVSGNVNVCVMHRAMREQSAVVETMHELAYNVGLPVTMPPDSEPVAEVDVVDVVADSVPSGRGRTLRVEARVSVVLNGVCKKKQTVIEDLYTISGAAAEPERETMQALSTQQWVEAQESIRLPVILPEGAPPVDTVIAAFARPCAGKFEQIGKRLQAEGTVGITLIYLPVESDIPCSVHVREPFTISFPAEGEGTVFGGVRAVECTGTAKNGDRVELRMVMTLQAIYTKTAQLTVVTDIKEGEEAEREHGFIVVWPQAGETRWQTARRLRVAPESLKTTQCGALIVLKR